MKKSIIFLFTIFFICSGQGIAQAYIENDSTYTFLLKDGTTISGKVKIIEERSSYAVKVGKKMKVILDEEILDFYYPGTEPQLPKVKERTNLHDHKYFIMPSSYGLKKGESHYQNYYLLQHQLNYGISDKFTMGVGLLPIFIFGTSSKFFISLMPKLNIPYKNRKGAFAIYGMLASPSEYDYDDGYIYSIHASNTFGTLDKQITLGGGYFYGESFEELRYDVFLNGSIRIGNRWSFLAENHYFFNQDSPFCNITGFRYMPNRYSLTFGFATFLAPGESYILPWLSMGLRLKS